MRVLLPAHLQLPAGKFLEVTGKVQGDKSVRLVRARSRAAPRNAAQRRATPGVSQPHPFSRPQTGVTALGDNFDLDTYNDAIIAAAAFPTVF